jgi:hypothetical protein
VRPWVISSQLPRDFEKQQHFATQALRYMNNYALLLLVTL